jgi:hypothetical protein
MQLLLEIYRSCPFPLQAEAFPWAQAVVDGLLHDRPACLKTLQANMTTRLRYASDCSGADSILFALKGLSWKLGPYYGMFIENTPQTDTFADSK